MSHKPDPERGYVMSKESRREMSLVQRGNTNNRRGGGWKHTPEACQKMTENRKGKQCALRTPYGFAVEDKLKELKKSAEARGKEWTIHDDIARTMLVSACHYCGKIPDWKPRLSRSKERARPGGIDRMDNEKGYVEGNCVPCCFRCNVGKHVMHVDEFLDWIELVYERVCARRKNGDHMGIVLEGARIFQQGEVVRYVGPETDASPPKDADLLVGFRRPWIRENATDTDPPGFAYDLLEIATGLRYEQIFEELLESA